MVIRRIFRQFGGGKRRRLPRWQPGPFTYSAFRYLLSDSDSYKRRMSYRKKPFVKSKRIPLLSDSLNIGTTQYTIPLTDVDAGTGNTTRHGNLIKLQKCRFKATLEWDQAGTPATIVRFIVASINPDDQPTGITPSANIYNGYDFPGIKHVYKDFRVTRRTSTDVAVPISFTIPLKNLSIPFKGSDGTTDAYKRQLYLYIVSDTTGSTTDLTDVRINTTFIE